MDHPFLTPFEHPPDEPIPKPTPVVPLTVAPPPTPRTGAEVNVVIGVLGTVVLVGLVWLCRPTDPPTADTPVSVTPRMGETTPPPTSPGSVFEEQDELDRRMDRLVEAVSGGQADVKVRLAQMRAVLGDARFLADLADCARRAGVVRPLTADERAKLTELSERNEQMQARIAGRV